MPVFIIFAYITCVRTQIGKLTSAQTDLLDIIKKRRGSDRPRLNGKPRQIRRAAHAYLTIEYMMTTRSISSSYVIMGTLLACRARCIHVHPCI